MRQHTTTCLLLILILVGCKKESDAGQAEAEMYSRLDLWAKHINMAYDAGLPIDKQATLDQALNLLAERNILEVSLDRLKYDYWGREYRWKVTETQTEIVIKVSSNGRDAISQDRDGVISVEVARRKDAEGKISVTFKGRR